MGDETKIKAGIYAGNGIIPIISKHIVGGPTNVAGACFYGALDVLGKVSPRIKNSKFTRLSELLGTGVFGVKSIADLFSAVNGDYASIGDFILDASMTYQLGKDALRNYQGRDLITDCEQIYAKAKRGYHKAEGLAGRLKRS